jgi:hypothetical protein
MRYTSLFSLAFLLQVAPAFAEWDQNVRTITIQLANDPSGLNADRCIPADGKKYPISSFWGNTALSRNGGIYATNGQLIAFPQDGACTIECAHGTLDFNARTTWLSLAHGQSVNLQGATVSCRENRW